MKRTWIVAAAVAVLAASALAWSQPYGMGPGMMGGYGPGAYGVDLGADQREQMQRGGRGR